MESLQLDSSLVGSCDGTPIHQVAAEIIHSRYRRVQKSGRRIDDRSPAADYHRLRIRCKALRDAMEFHVNLFGRPAKGMIRVLVGLKDLLGEHQDADVALH